MLKTSRCLALVGAGLLTLAVTSCSSSSGNASSSNTGSGGSSGSVQSTATGASASGNSSAAQGKLPHTLVIATQQGVLYAPLTIATYEGWLQKKLPGTKITVQKVSSGSAIRDGVIAGKVDVGAAGPGPFLVGWANGVDWKLISALSSTEIWLMAKDAKYKTLADLKGATKIAVPSPDSTQAVILAKAAEKELGDAHAFDSNLVSLSHPNALQALVSGQVAADFGSPPFQYEEKAKGAHIVLNSTDIFPVLTAGMMYMPAKEYNEYPGLGPAILSSVQQAINLIKTDPDQAAAILVKANGNSVTQAQYKEYLTEPSVGWSTTPQGIAAFASAMKEFGLIKKAPNSWKDVVFQSLQASNGS